MQSNRNPILVLILNFAVGALVAHGVVDPSQQNDLVNSFAEFIGLLIITATSAVSLYHVLHDLYLRWLAQKQGFTVVVPPAPTPPVIEQPTVPDSFRG